MIYHFGDFELHEEDFCLFQKGSRVSMEPKALCVLLHLVQHAGHLVEKRSLLDTVWANTYVADNTLTRAVAALRHELGDSSRKPRYIQTIPTRGYRFIAEVETQVSVSPPEPVSLDTFVQPATAASPPLSEKLLSMRTWLSGVAFLAMLLVLVAVVLMR